MRRHVFVASLALADADAQVLSATLIGQVCGGILIDIVLVVAVVFIEREVALVGSGEDAHDDRLLRTAQVADLTIVRQNAASLDVDRILIHRELPRHGLTALKHCARLVLQPLPLGNPSRHRGQAAVLVAGIGDWDYKHSVAKHILLFHFIGFFRLGIVVVHGTTERETCLVILASHGVDVRNESIASVDNFCDALLGHVVEGPRLFVQTRVLCAVAAQDGQVLPHLHGTGVELGLDTAAELLVLVSADVVTPIAI